MFTKIKFSAILLLSFAVSANVSAQVPMNDDKKPDTTIVEEAKESVSDNIPVVSLDENDGQDGSSQNVSSLLTAGRDPFYSGATFHFNAVRFRLRGYDADLFSTYMNGVPMENLDNGFTPFGLWGGLNDVMRNRENTLGLRTTTFGYGDIGGATSYDTRASHQRKQTNFNYAISNRNYVHRFIITHSTGLSKKGWAFTFSGSRRWADEGFVDGTYYDGWSGFLGIDKKISNRQLLSLVAFVTPTESGRQGASVEEMRKISGDNFYNPYWGYQNGKKRNSSIAKTQQPIIILTHDLQLNDKVSIVTAATTSFGKRSTTGLDWYNAPDPRPDYYRYLPSYQDDPKLAAEALEQMQNDVNLRQINWDKLYNTNYMAYDQVQNANGIEGNTVSGRRSHYIVEERIIDMNRFALNSTINASLAQNIDLTAGASYQYQNNHYYKKVDDLLGGEFYVDVNQFAERDFATDPNASQNDLNAPNRILGVGDKFGYNYEINIQKATAWAQAVFKFKRVDFFAAFEGSHTEFYRKGNTKVGLFPEESFGKSAVQDFNNYAAKAGVTYKINGRNYAFFNGSVLTRAPFFENSYIAPRTRNIVQDDLKSEEINSFEAGYIWNAPKIKFRATGYYTTLKNQLNVITFYNDEYRNFVNYAVRDINKEHLGAEIGLEAKLYKGLSINAAAAIGRYTFTSNQIATVTQDNSSVVLSNDVVYAKNYNVPSPQRAFTVGLDYRSPKFWFVNINLNYFDKMWLDFNPIRRTTSAVDGVDPNSTLFKQIVGQTELPSQYTVDCFAGYSWKMNKKFKSLKKNTFLLLNFGVNNLLNNTNIISGGFEQMRFDFAGKDVDKFPARYFYSYGLNFFASIGIRF